MDQPSSASTNRDNRSADLPWDYPAPFCIDLEVGAELIDHYQHVNNAAYVTWLEEAAWAHTRALGLSLAKYQALDRGMAIVRHEIDYLAAAYEGEHLCLGTWVYQGDGKLRLQRRFQLIRPADQKTLLRASTDFVCIELSSGRPKRMPNLYRETYQAAMLSPAQRHPDSD